MLKLLYDQPATPPHPNAKGDKFHAFVGVAVAVCIVLAIILGPEAVTSVFADVKAAVGISN